MRTPRGIDPALAALLQRSELDHFDYTFAMDCLREYKAPRVKLNHLVGIGALERLKKGLYLFARPFARRPYCVEVLANLIYGPSYVSLEWACSFYGLIPERVEVVTSATTKRSRFFDTPLRRFSYDHIHSALYPVGVQLMDFGEGYKALLATKEKALADLLVLRRGRCRSKREMEQILVEDLRVELDDLISFDLERLLRIHKAHPHSAIAYLLEVVKSVREPDE